MNRKTENILAIILVGLLVVSVFIFTVTKETNKIMTIVASIMLTCAMAFGLWLQYFSNVKPLGLGIFLMLITLICVVASLYISRYFGTQQSNSTPIAIITGLIVSKILNKNLPYIRKLSSKFYE